MRISLIAIGSKMPAWVEQGYAEYRKRLPREIDLQLLEIPLPKRSKNSDLTRLMEKEAEQMREAIGDGDRVIALDLRGQSLSTEKLADKLDAWLMSGQNYSLLIGGPDGLHAALLASAHERWSLSALTLPHPLVRVLLAEQIYRAWSILNNHPYHR